MNVLVCIKRIPLTGGRISLTADGQAIDTRLLGFTISPHEECAIEQAVRLVETFGGTATVLTLGPAEAVEQLRDAMAVGIDRAIHLETDEREWDARATANAIVDAIRIQALQDGPFDLLLLGNEAADTGDYQVGIRVAHALDIPCVTGVKALEVKNGSVTAQREHGGSVETFTVALPAVVTVKEGLNLPRYPSLPGRLKAKKKPIVTTQPVWNDGGMKKIRLLLPPEEANQVELLGKGTDAAPRVVEVLRQLGLA